MKLQEINLKKFQRFISCLNIFLLGAGRSWVHHREGLPCPHGGPQSVCYKELPQHGGAPEDAPEEVQHGARPYQAQR